jgi:Zn-dependent M28 family amino/carboxypeptidase
MGWLVSLGVVVAALAAAAGYMTMMPGTSHGAELPPLSQQEREVAERLRRHVAELARTDRNLQRPEALERAARYIEAAFAEAGLQPQAHVFESGGATVRNIEVSIPAAGAQGGALVVVGAHYDSVPGSPGADDNASGVAALLELARMLAKQELPGTASLRLIAFVNEEPPYFMTPQMGSEASARRARGRNESIRAMVSLEMLGSFNGAPGSQEYPPPIGWLYPDRGNFIAFVGDLGARALVRQAIGAFRAHATIPSEGIAAPAVIPGIHWSDHWSFRQHGYPAIMVTDTSFFRYPHYHLYTDTPEKLDYDRMARVTVGVAGMTKQLVR